MIIILNKRLKTSIWPKYETQTGTTNLGQSGPGSNGNNRVLYIPPNSKTGAWASDAVSYHTRDTHWAGGTTPLHRFNRWILQPQSTGCVSFAINWKELTIKLQFLSETAWWFALVSLLNGTWTFMGYLMPKISTHQNKRIVYYLSHNGDEIS